ncbi:MAG: PaaI family thioesterase [Burkholderiales bacterium]|jgi:uncharacterized protein (TIGR00369 family)|nr:PaaI family thioesterase [Burkholderiales bacterium]
MPPAPMTAAAPPDPAPVPEGFYPRRFGGSGFVATNGPFYIRKLDGGGVQLGFRVEPRHCNPMGILHGGMMATFCDMLLPISAHYLSPALARRFLPTIQLQVDYLGASPLGAWVQGEAQLLRHTRSLVFMQGLASADGDTVARVSGIFKIGRAFDDSADFGAARFAAGTPEPPAG